MTSVLKRSVFRVTIKPSAETGLEKVSQVMVDKLMTQKRTKIGQKIGKVPAETMQAIEQALMLLLGLAN